MKIREKLFLGFSLYVFLAAVLGFWAYRELLTITTRITLVEVADDITNALLEVRRYEKNYLLYRDKENLDELMKYLGTLKGDIDNTRIEIIKEIGTDHYEMMKKAIAEYERLVDNLINTFKAQDELVSEVRSSGRGIEKTLKGYDLRAFLILRRYEKNLIIYKDQQTYETFKKTAHSLGRGQEKEFVRYEGLTDRLFGLYNDERESIAVMRWKAREIQSFTEALAKRERDKIGGILTRSMNMLLIALIAVVVVGSVTNIRLSRNIAEPIGKLERVTKKIAMGDFSEAVEVEGSDEITSLEVSFNQMEERLKDALSALEDTVKKLQEKQAQLVEAEKLASIGIFIAGVAHEINNPLTSVLTFSNLILEKMPEEDPNHKKIRMIARETARARTIVRQLLSFAKEAPIKPMKKDINCPISDIIETLSAQEAFKDITLKVNLTEDLPFVYIDSAKIGQVVLNILLNAIQSISPPGTIEVSTRLAGKFVEIVFSDTGCGISEDHASKIFDPFFTTKDSSKGTGLGLAVSYGIIKKHGGYIDVKSTPGEGSTFVVRLPVKSDDGK